MKKIVDRKKYDTLTADLLGEWSNGMGTSDFDHCREALYRTQNGAYFVAGEGGAKSKYCVPVGNNGWSGGSDLTPLSESEAYEWAETHLSASRVEQLFPQYLTEA